MSLEDLKLIKLKLQNFTGRILNSILLLNKLEKSDFSLFCPNENEIFTQVISGKTKKLLKEQMKNSDKKNVIM